MESKPVSNATCASHRALTEERLLNMGRDITEIRSGVGKLIRIVTESNGTISLCDQVRRNNEFREQMHELGIVDIVRSNAEFREQITEASNNKKKNKWALILSGCGWAVTTALWILSRFVPPIR